MKWPSFPWKSSYRWQYPFPYCVVCQPIPCLKYVSYNDFCVCVIYFCICPIVRHLPNIAEHFNRVFSTCAARKTKTLGTEWMLVVDWLIFRHGVFPAVKSNRVENAPCDVTREILLNIIHSHQIKIRQKKLRNLFTPSEIFFVTKFHVFVIMSKATSEVFSSCQRNRTVLSFRERHRRTVLYQTNCGYDGTKRGFIKCDLIATKRTQLFLLRSSIALDSHASEQMFLKTVCRLLDQ